MLVMWTSACTVPDLKIEESADPSAQAKDSGIPRGVREEAGTASPDAMSASEAATAPNDAGAMVSTQPQPEAGSGDAVDGSTSPPGPTNEEAGAPKDPSRSCIAWRSVDARSEMVPPGSVEGGLETVAGVPKQQYVCRFRPENSAYAIPGKYVVGLGCYVTRRVNGAVEQASVLTGTIDLLTPASGCSFSWRTANGTTLPASAVDLGDPAGGKHYACHGFYNGISSGTQIGTIIPSTDDKPVHQCWFQSFSGASQPADPTQFEVLAQDTP